MNASENRRWFQTSVRALANELPSLGELGSCRRQTLGAAPGELGSCRRQTLGAALDELGSCRRQTLGAALDELGFYLELTYNALVAELRLINDFLFKLVFGEKGSEPVLRALLNALLGYKGEEKIVSLTIGNPGLTKEFASDKRSTLDLKAVDGRGQWYILNSSFKITTVGRVT